MNNLKRAFESQCRIGWDQFFRGRITLCWQAVIANYYHERHPGPAFTPDQWMQTTINAIWDFSLTLWRQRNAAYHGADEALPLERKQKDTALKAAAVYRDTAGNLIPSDDIILHWKQLNEILNWTKQHLDAYLATAKVICEWNVEPG